MNKTWTTATTDEILRIAHDSIERDYNRLPSDEILARLDPEGAHVMGFAMPHEHINGEQVEPHMRTEWLLKLKDQKPPARIFLDMSMENYAALDKTYVIGK